MFSSLSKIFNNKEELDTSSPFRLLFATDIHGSGSCFRKLLNTVKNAQLKPNAIIIGGDITGKDMVYLVYDEVNDIYRTTDRGKSIVLRSEKEIATVKQKADASGAYLYQCSLSEYQDISIDTTKQSKLLANLIEERVSDWMNLASERWANIDSSLIINTGNDDFFSIDLLLENSNRVIFPEGKIVGLENGISVLSCGYANKTPFLCPRDVSEEDLYRRISENIQKYIRQGGDMKRCILNLHCPPIGTLLDIGPKLNEKLQPELSAFGKENAAVGSTAVRRIIEEYQPLLSLHGHIHESPGIDRLGNTVIINPGSEYQSGILKFAVIEFNGNKLNKYYLRTAI